MQVSFEICFDSTHSCVTNQLSCHKEVVSRDHGTRHHSQTGFASVLSTISTWSYFSSSCGRLHDIAKAPNNFGFFFLRSAWHLFIFLSVRVRMNWYLKNFKTQKSPLNCNFPPINLDSVKHQVQNYTDCTHRLNSSTNVWDVYFQFNTSFLQIYFKPLSKRSRSSTKLVIMTQN